jgi:hypothetical protein
MDDPFHLYRSKFFVINYRTILESLGPGYSTEQPPWTKASPLKSVLKMKMKSLAETIPPGPPSAVT